MNPEAKLFSDVEGLSKFPHLMNDLIKAALESEVCCGVLDFDKEPICVCSRSNVARLTSSIPRVKLPSFTIRIF